jgi:hypothetical protein
MKSQIPSHFVAFTKDDALKFVNSNMAFTGDVLDWLVAAITSEHSETYIADLAPVKLHRKLAGPIQLKSWLQFNLVAPNAAGRLRFKKADSGPPSKNKPATSKWGDKCRLDELGESGFALVVNPSSQVKAKVTLEVSAGVNGTIVDGAELPQHENGKRIFIWHFKIIDPADMVGWYDPLQLMRTGVEVFFSTLFGRHADYRLMEALTTVGSDKAQSDKLYYDFTVRWQKDEERCDKYVPLIPPEKDEGHGDKDVPEVREEIWIDYVGDVGDGWHPTYAIAHTLAQTALTLEWDGKGEKKKYSTQRGDILIFGGDQVYPIANRVNYKQRLVGPYDTALPSADYPHPHAFAIPGNHDWYDSLVTFTRLFCQKRWFAGWQTDQSRSYFALKLPGNWWALGTDVQLDSDIDVPQLEYFREVAKSIAPGDRVIIFTAEPHWVYAALYKKDDSNYSENNLAFFEKKILPDGVNVVAFIAGDQHHYRRFEADNGSNKITAGGGGAFLHPTHGEEITELEGGYKHVISFPSPGKSRILSLLNLTFLIRNPFFGVLTGFIYMLASWTVMANLSKAFTFKDAARTVMRQLVVNPSAVFLVLMLFLGFVLFTDTHSKWYRWIAGPVHGAAHVFALFFIGWGATYFTINSLGLAFRSVRQLLAAGAIIFAGGWLIGSTILGLYLLISLNWCGRHSNEAFSALAIQDWKNFLRIRVDDKGNLTIFPIGIPKVPRKWVRRKDGVKGPGYEPHKDHPIKPILIENPIPLGFARAGGGLVGVKSKELRTADPE